MVSTTQAGLSLPSISTVTPNVESHWPEARSTMSFRTKRARTRFLPDNIYDAIRMFKASRFAMDVFGEDVHTKFAEIKLAAAERSPKALGAQIKTSEIQYHHEVTNQYLWSMF